MTAAAARCPRAAGLLTIATYNIHRCLGRDGRHDAHRVAAVIRELRADAVALQEVDSRPLAEGAVDQLAYLAESTGMQAISGPTLQHRSGSYGNALLTRLPRLRVDRIDLSAPGREARGVLDVDLDLGRWTLRVLATHLGLSWRERRMQVRRLVQLIEVPEAPATVLLGDVNEWLPGRFGLRRLDAALGRARSVASFPAWRPTLRLDRIWARPAALMLGLRAHRSALARAASDHLPVVAELLAPSSAAQRRA